MTHTIPAVSAVFVCGLFIPFTNGIGALTGMIGGIGLGAIRAIPYFIFQEYCDDRANTDSHSQTFNSYNWLVCLNFNYFSILLFVLTMGLICGVSWFTERPSEAKTQGLLSDLVVKTAGLTEEGIQLSNLEFAAFETSVGQTPVPNAVSEDAGSSRHQTKPDTKPHVEQDILQPKWRLLSVLSAEGYLAHIFSIFAATTVTILILVFH